MATATKQNPVIRLWPKTRVKLDIIAEHQRRKINSTVDALCDEYIAKAGIRPRRARIARETL